MKRILTGDRPTGYLHLGHYVGTLENRIKMQDEYEMFVLNADVQALTDNFDNPEKVRQNVINAAIGNLAVGVDPEKVTYFIQSMIPQIAELTVFFANLVTVARLERNPTVKSEIAEKGFDKTLPLGFFMYPVSQAADILIVKGEIVPVGEDQVPHVEQTREIARKFNSVYGEVFPEPEAVVGKIARLVGTDGNAKMSKSIGNTIYLRDDEETIKKQVMSMYTDPNRVHPTDPGNVEGNPVFIYHDAFNPNTDEVNDLKERYQKGTVGDVEVKEKLVQAINTFLEPIRERHRYYEEHAEEVYEMIEAGNKKALDVAKDTMNRVREAMKIDYPFGL
ncbi:tryptophan--tRNA ligase [candidate division WWE3 bacterium]|uniref:Tryptophan--tRNA ligase n=1 Tax=candidate division WWE3 bacterium TaxID=2053526 RepID=A0A955LHX5_UNCKA|nr:tryptophan--tRNA ligase [candidate division WWE3 bacterium]